MAQRERPNHCENYWLGAGGGMCGGGGGRTEGHHVDKRSGPTPRCPDCNGTKFISVQVEMNAPPRSQPCTACNGTGHAPRQMAYICTPCHQKEERFSPEVGPWRYRATLPGGEYITVECPDKAALDSVLSMEPETDQELLEMLMSHYWPDDLADRWWPERTGPQPWRVARFWDNCRGELMMHSRELLREAEVGAEIIRQGGWRLARAVFKLQEMGDAWRLQGHESLADLSESLGYRRDTLKRYLAAEETLHLNPAITQEQRESFRAESMELMVSARSHVAQMDTEQIQKVIETAQIAPVKEVVQLAKTIIARGDAHRAGMDHARVTLIVSAATLECEVAYRAGEDPVEKAKASFINRDWAVGIDWADDEQQSWEDTDE